MASGTTDPSQAAADENAYEGADVEVSPTETAPEGDTHDDADHGDAEHGDAKPGGLGTDGTIPDDPKGVAAGHTGTASHFNPEEDDPQD